MARKSNDSAVSLLQQVLARNLKVSPELQAKRKRLLTILAASLNSEQPDDSNDSANSAPAKSAPPDEPKAD